MFNDVHLEVLNKFVTGSLSRIIGHYSYTFQGTLTLKSNTGISSENREDFIVIPLPSRKLAISTDGNDIKIVNLNTKENILLEREGRHISQIISVKDLPDVIAISNESSEVEIWNIRTGKQKRSLKNKKETNSIVSLPNGRIFCLSIGGRITIWDLTTNT